ncbi:MAG: hypothetical protein JO090_09620 [Rhizobacter sp.]|nr:hypothetical protein [Rhizobacter sp.]
MRSRPRRRTRRRRAVANANSVNLADNIERLQLDADRIPPPHGRVVAVSERYAVAQRAPR